MPRRRPEERSSSSSSSPPRTARSSSRPRAAATRSRSPQTSSARSSAPRPRPSAAHSPSLHTEKPTRRTARSAWYSPTPEQTDYHDYSSSRSSSDEGASSGFIDAIFDAIKRSRTASKEDPVAAPEATEVANSSGSIACVTQAKAFQDCLDEFETDISNCQLYMDKWCKCKKSSKSTLTT